MSWYFGIPTGEAVSDFSIAEVAFEAKEALHLSLHSCLQSTEQKRLHAAKVESCVYRYPSAKGRVCGEMVADKNVAECA